MKKTIFSFGLALVLLACSKKAPVDYALFTGKIENLNAKEVSLVKSDQSFKKNITVEANGTFTDTVRAIPGLYFFNVGKNRTNIYLENGNALIVQADAKDLNNTLDISGKGSQAANYILFKDKKIAELKGERKAFYALGEVEFKNKVKTINATLNKVLDTMQGLSDNYKALENRNLNYVYLLELSRYAGGFHRTFAKERSYKPSAGFTENVETIDLNNGEDFYFSNAYSELVKRHYKDQIKKLIKQKGIEDGLEKVSIYSEITNQSIKNELIFSGAEFDIYNTSKFEEFYQIFMNASTNEENNAKITKIYNKLITVNNGQPSPKFVDYENNAGGTLSLDDFKGKYTYIDLWATWCGPCIKELPDLGRIEKDYHGRNINFLSISIDAAKDHDKWKKMVKDKGLGGIQLIADKAFDSQFIKAYSITSIPRFILLDPEGLVVSQHAPFPSNPELIELFNSLGI